MSTFGGELRGLRLARKLSQLDLADAAETTQRHLSYLERGRSAPGRDIVVRLGKALDLDCRERDRLLLAAGFAAERVGHEALPEEMLERMRRLVDGYLPYPALVTGPDGAIAQNVAVEVLTEGVPEWLLREPLKLYLVSVHPQGLAPRVIDLPAWGSHVFGNLRSLAAAMPTPGLAADLELVKSLLPPGTPGENHGFAAPLRLRIPGGELRLNSTTTSLETATDPVFKGYRLEVFLPADGFTGDYLALRHYAYLDPSAT